MLPFTTLMVTNADGRKSHFSRTNKPTERAQQQQQVNKMKNSAPWNECTCDVTNMNSLWCLQWLGTASTFS